MNEHIKPVREIVVATIYESITSIFKDQLAVEEMERVIKMLELYVSEEKNWWRKK